VRDLHGLRYEVAQSSLLHALRRRVYRCQRVIEGRSLLRAQNTVLRVHDLEAAGSSPDVTVSADSDTAFELRLLLAREIEKSQGDLAASIANANQQAAPPPIYGFSQQNFPFNQAPVAGPEFADFCQLAAIFITQWKKKQQIFDPLQIEPPESSGKRRPDTF